MALGRRVLGLLCLFQGARPSAALTRLDPAADELLLVRDDPRRAAYVPDLPRLLVRAAADGSNDSAAAMTMQPGAPCAAEGQWNCLTTCWQRCASGAWSGTMALAPGTACVPAGLSYSMHIVDSDGAGAGAGASSAVSALSTVLSATTGSCTCALSPSTSTSTSCSSASSSSSASSTAAGAGIPHESGTLSDGGGFVSGSSAAGSGRNSGLAVAVVCGVGTLAVVFAHLLM